MMEVNSLLRVQAKILTPIRVIARKNALHVRNGSMQFFLVKALTIACSELEQEGIQQGQGSSFIRQMRILRNSDKGLSLPYIIKSRHIKTMNMLSRNVWLWLRHRTSCYEGVCRNISCSTDMWLISVDGWVTMLQAGRSRFQKPDKVIEFFSMYLILPAALDRGIYSASNRNEDQIQKKNVSAR
jgi:hypothetical protein